MGPESSILIKRSKVSDVWVTAFGGNNSGNQREQDYSGLRTGWKKGSGERDDSFKSLAVEGKREGARKKGEVKVRLRAKGQEYFHFKC